jgi:hypothetical protein
MATKIAEALAFPISNNNETTTPRLTNVLQYTFLLSPVILAIVVLFISFSYSNYKGIIYLGFLIGLFLLRTFIFNVNEWDDSNNPTNPEKCKQIQFSQYGNSTLSAFVFGFTMIYILFPMIYNSQVNIWILIGLLMYFVGDFTTRANLGCLSNFGGYAINFLVGSVLGCIIISLMYAGNSGRFLFFNEFSNNQEICSMPSKQTFKCSVYKNGELIGSA